MFSPHALSCVALALGLLLPNLLMAASASTESQFVGVAKCKTCHKKELMGNQHASWLAGPHARAYQTLSGEESRLIAQRLGLRQPANESKECLSCHATAFGTREDQVEFTIIVEDSVQCESCHGPGSRYRKKKIMSKVEKAHSLGLWDSEDPEVCATCHNQRSPTFDPKRYRLPDGRQAGFDFRQAVKAIAHPIPEHVKGHYVELEKKQKQARRREKEKQRAEQGLP